MGQDLFDSFLGQPPSVPASLDLFETPEALSHEDLLHEDLRQENLKEDRRPENLRQNDKFFEILLHQMPKKLQQGLEKILLPNAVPLEVSSREAFDTSADASTADASFGFCADIVYQTSRAKTKDPEIDSLLASKLNFNRLGSKKYRSNEMPSLLASAQGKGGIYREAWRDEWYAYCAQQAQSSADSCWKLLKDFGLSYYVQERYFQNCYKQSSLCLEREQRGEFYVLLQRDSRYPLSLLELQQAPRILFWQGRLLPQNALSTSIIGTRKAGSWGMHQAWQEALLLQKEKSTESPSVWQRSKQEHWVLSGLARGCDYAAHRGALDAGGPTLALLASGFDRIYPKQHRGLAQEIIDCGGALVSEYIPTADPMKWRFIQRDRLQSAMAQRILLIESSLDGGSMHTVRTALQLGKPIFTLEGTESCWQITAVDASMNLKGQVYLQRATELLKNLDSLEGGREKEYQEDGKKAPQVPVLLEANYALLREELAQPWN